MGQGILPRALLGAALLAAALGAPAQVPVPQLQARVTDLTSTLSFDQARALEQKLAALEQRKGSQVAVLLVPSTQPETVEQYAIRVFDQWKLGRKSVDDGVLVLVAKNDRRLRIEVGRGLEGAIPDAYAKRIIDEEITPRFKQGDFFGGISSGVDRIARLVDGEPMPPPPRSARSRSSEDRNVYLFFGLVAVLLIGGMLRSVFGRLLGSTLAGTAAGIVAFTLGGLVFALICAAVAFLLCLVDGSRSGDGSAWSSGGGSWSSGGGGGYSGGGGFSGGGGSSGGGGASGSW